MAKLKNFLFDMGDNALFGARDLHQARFNQDALFLESAHASRLEAEGFNVKGGH